MTEQRTGRRATVAVFGLGRIGTLHARNVATLTTAHLACVVDEKAQLARGIATDLDCPWSTKVAGVLEDSSIEAIVITTPTELHEQMVTAALTAGKHVFCEKPLALTPDACRRLNAQAGAAGRLLQVGFHRRFDPDWMECRARVCTGELGRIYLFRSSLRERQPPPAGYIETAGPFFADFTIHDLDTARWLLGEEIVEVQAFAAALSGPPFELPNRPDQAVVVIRFAGGALGVIDNSRTGGYGYECAGELLAERACVRIGERQTRHNLEWLREDGATRDYAREFQERFATAYRREIEHFVAAVRGNLIPEVSGEDALIALELAIAAGRSLREHRPIVLGTPSRLAEGAAG